MFLKHLHSGDLIEVVNVAALFDPCEQNVSGRFHHGEEMQEIESFSKENLVFPSGEALPKCWVNPHYRS